MGCLGTLSKNRKMREPILLLLLVVLCCQICGNPIRNSEARDDANDKDSSSIERVFISDRLQDSLESFFELVDTSDFFILALPGKKYHRVQDSIHSRDIITVSFIVNDNDTIINFSGRHGIAPPTSIGMGKIFFNDKVDIGAKYVNKTLVAVNSHGHIPLDRFLDSQFIDSLDYKLYIDRYCSYMDVAGGIIPYLRIYVINGDSLRVEFTNDKNIECLDTVINSLIAQ